MVRHIMRKTELAIRTGIDRATISYYINGRKKINKLEHKVNSLKLDVNKYISLSVTLFVQDIPGKIIPSNLSKLLAFLFSYADINTSALTATLQCIQVILVRFTSYNKVSLLLVNCNCVYGVFFKESCRIHQD